MVRACTARAAMGGFAPHFCTKERPIIQRLLRVQKVLILHDLAGGEMAVIR
jgi:hypothetical protein